MNQPNEPKNPDPTNAAWEDAMTRDFDARVRDLHEAPLDIGSVKGKAHKIKRNRRAAVAGGILGVAAVITPIAVVVSGNGDARTDREPVVDDPSETIADPAAGVDYLAGRTWHQADGDRVELPEGDYSEAGLWDGQLVTLTPGAEVYSKLSIFAADGGEPEEIEDVAGFAVSADGTILSYTKANGELIARWDGGESVLAEDLIDSGGGESVGGAPVAVTGTPPCLPESGNCLVRINNYDSGCRGIGSSDVPAPVGALACGDEQDDLLVYVTRLSDLGYQCAGVGEGPDRALLWPATCDYDLQDISPDGQYVVGGQVDSDGLGPKTVSILDARTGTEVASHTAPTDSAFLWSDIAWSAAGYLLVSEWDAGEWRLLAIDPATGDPTVVAGPVAADEVSNPFTLIHH